MKTNTAEVGTVHGIGLGLAALGRPGYLNLGHSQDLTGSTSVEAMRARTHTMLDAAWEAGVRYIDAARSYGLAESFLGEWFTRHPDRRRQLRIGSKWGYTYTAEWRTDAKVHEVKDHALATFERQWPETLAALGGAPDIYLIHSVTPDSPALDDATLLARLAQLREEGVTVGISTSGPHQAEVIERAVALSVSGTAPFQAVQSTWNLLEPSAGAALQRAHDSGWLVVAKESLANGRLTARGDVPALHTAAEARGTNPDSLALALALAQPFVDIVLSGAATEEHLASNLRALDLVRELDPGLAEAAGSGESPAPGNPAGAGNPAGSGDLARLGDLAHLGDLTHLGDLAEDPAAYWSARSDLSWN